MERTEDLLLEPLFDQLQVKRRSNLPLWMKIFIWIFMLTGAAAIIGPIAALLGVRFQLSLYGLSSDDPISPMGLFITALFLLKGVASFGLWTEKRWAVQLGMVDAIAGIVTCILVMGNGFMNHYMDLRLELVLLIPYQLRLQKIREQWLNGTATT